MGYCKNMRRLHKIFILLFVATSFDSVLDSAPSIQDAYFKPFVIRDNIDYTKLVLYCGEENIQELKIELPWLVSEQNPVVLSDDGENGDELANDHYFTKDNLLFNLEISRYSSINFSSAEITYIYKDGTFEKDNLNYALTLIIINPTIYPIPNIKRSIIDPNIDNTDYVIAIKNNFDSDTEITASFYRYFEDDKDFFAIAYPFGKPSTVAAYFSIVSNNISGIGLDSFDFTNLYGSNNRLQGIVSLLYGGGLGTLNHELLHRWAVYLDSKLNLTYSGGHWSALVATTSGFGGGSVISGGVYKQIEQISGNNYRAHILDPFGEMKYNDLELYLMGLKDQTVIKDPFESLIEPISLGYTNENGSVYELFSASGVSETKMEDIIKIHGNRIPSSLLAPKRFNIALIVSCNRSLTEVEFAFYNYLAEEYEKAKSDAGLTFSAATSGLAEMHSRVMSIGDKPQLVTPVNDAEIPINEINYCWHKLNNAVNYRFQLSDDHEFSDKIVDSLNSDTTLIRNFGNLPKQYFWRVKAINNSGESYWSEIRSFTIINALLSILPVNLNVGSEAGSTTYCINSNTSWTVNDDADWLTVDPANGRGDGTITATYTANTLISSRVGTITISGTGVSPQSVTVTQSEPTLVETLDDLKVSLYPNPTKDHIYIKFDETITADFSISVLDLLGKSYFLIENKGANIDKEQFIDLASLKSGVYFLIIRSKDIIKNYKIIKE
jgi:hypothetical protein